MKKEVLGDEYELTLVFVGEKRARALNKKFRNKDYATDILSFPIDKETGEIFVYPPKAEKKAKEFGRNFPNYLQFLFIHGLFHLKGFDHGSRMEREEARVRALFSI
jgi:probable rRNA maturation factor